MLQKLPIRFWFLPPLNFQFFSPSKMVSGFASVSFLLVITFSVLLTLALVSWYYALTAPSQYGSSWMGQMWGSHLGTDQNHWGMGGMMGGDSSSTLTPSYLWLLPTALIGAVAIAIVGVGFYLAYPELKYIRGKPCSPQKTLAETKETATSAGSEAHSCEMLLKTMTPEEQQVLNVLIKHNGKYLQKYVSKEAELSRLKTHRIIARFAQRGIVTTREFGNTNEIYLADWIKNTK
jgi:hypothetical protein